MGLDVQEVESRYALRKYTSANSGRDKIPVAHLEVRPVKKENKLWRLVRRQEIRDLRTQYNSTC